MTTMTALAINVPLMVLAFALWTGIPLWMVFKRPDRKPPRVVPQYRRVRAGRQAREVRAASPAWNVDRLRLSGR